MQHLLFNIIVLFSIVGQFHFSDEFHTVRKNYCTKIESYTENQVVPETKRVAEVVRTLCWSLTLTCTKHKFNIVTVNKNVTVYKTKQVLDCCPGYQNKNDTCIPICRLPCGHGKCIAPDVCLCEPGWREPFCLIECESNKYGRGCNDNCTCIHAYGCDKETGFCHCLAGYTGDNCELSCPNNTYGLNCKNRCQCENYALCDTIDGECYCPPGYDGSNCEKPCKNGKYGDECEENCICIPENTESCHHVDGKCICKPGYKGENCEKECDDFTYGRNCSETCNCENSYFCDLVNGACFCKPGWIGATCSEKCPIGTFGENCTFNCEKCLNLSGACDHITGYCNCPPGLYGNSCDIICSPGYWGYNCSETCNCDISNCNPKSGKCLLSKGHSSDYYLQPRVLYIAISVVTLTIIFVSLCFIGCFKEDLSTKNTNRKYGSFCRLIRFKFCSKKTKSSAGVTTISNPVYEVPDVILESDRSDSDFIRGSISGGVKYFKNDAYDSEAADNQSNIGKDKVTGDVKIKKNDTKETDVRKSQVLNDLSAAFKEMKRCSSRKPNSAHSSTVELEKDYEPEKLEDFNVIENIYEKPQTYVKENMSEKSEFHAKENIYEK